MNYSFNNNYLYTFNHYFTQDSGNGGPPHVKTTERVNRNRKTVHEFHHWFATTNVLFNLIKRDRFQPKALSTVFNIPFVEDAADETPAGCAIPVRFAPRDGREKTIGRRTEERMRRKTITVHRWKLFFASKPNSMHPFFLHWNYHEADVETTACTPWEQTRERQKKNEKWSDNTKKEIWAGGGGIWKVKLNFDEGSPRVTMNCYARLDVRKWSLSLLILLGRVSPVSGNFQSRKTGTKPPCFFSPFHDSSYRSILSFGFSFHVGTFVSSMFVWGT